MNDPASFYLVVLCCPQEGGCSHSSLHVSVPASRTEEVCRALSSHEGHSWQLLDSHLHAVGWSVVAGSDWIRWNLGDVSLFLAWFHVPR